MYMYVSRAAACLTCPIQTRRISFPVSVPGMEEAMFTAYNDHTDIQMYRSLETPVAVNVNWSSPDRDVWTYDRLSFDFTNVSLEEVVRYFSGTP